MRSLKKYIIYIYMFMNIHIHIVSFLFHLYSTNIVSQPNTDYLLARFVFVDFNVICMMKLEKITYQPSNRQLLRKVEDQ